MATMMTFTDQIFRSRADTSEVDYAVKRLFRSIRDQAKTSSSYIQSAAGWQGKAQAAGDVYRTYRDFTKIMAQAIFSPSQFREQYRPGTMQHRFLQKLHEGPMKSFWPEGSPSAEPFDQSGRGGGIGDQGLTVFWLKKIYDLMEGNGINLSGNATAGIKSGYIQAHRTVGMGVPSSVSAIPPKQLLELVKSRHAVEKQSLIVMSRFSKVMGVVAPVMGVFAGALDLFWTNTKKFFNNAWAALGLSGIISRTLQPVGQAVSNMLAPILAPVQMFLVELFVHTIGPWIRNIAPRVQHFFINVLRNNMPMIKEFVDRWMPKVITFFRFLGSVLKWLLDHPKTALGTFIAIGGAIKGIGIALNVMVVAKALKAVTAMSALVKGMGAVTAAGAAGTAARGAAVAGTAGRVATVGAVGTAGAIGAAGVMGIIGSALAGAGVGYALWKYTRVGDWATKMAGKIIGSPELITKEEARRKAMEAYAETKSRKSVTPTSTGSSSETSPSAGNGGDLTSPNSALNLNITTIKEILKQSLDIQLRQFMADAKSRGYSSLGADDISRLMEVV